MKRSKFLLFLRFAVILAVLGVWTSALVLSQESKSDVPLSPPFRWRTGPPVVMPKDVGGISCYSIKDPSIVRYRGKWHLFCTIRGEQRSHAVVYLCFTDWEQANDAERILLTLHDGYYCAPQVFYFTPHKRWYMVCQAASDDWEPKYQPAFATNADIAAPESWSALRPLFGRKPENLKAWLDFWIICDESKAHLFFTSLDGKMWRSETSLGDFPTGWTEPAIALRGDVFEASHSYRIKGQDRYVTLIEAQNGHGWRYYKAYLADRLDGLWTPLAATREDSFASMKNVTQAPNRWMDSISHGEIIRAGYDQRIEIDPSQLRFLYQGVSDRQRAGKKYGQIPWQLGILECAEDSASP